MLILGNGDSPDGEGWEPVNSGNGEQFLSACGSVSTDQIQCPGCRGGSGSCTASGGSGEG